MGGIKAWRWIVTAKGKACISYEHLQNVEHPPLPRIGFMRYDSSTRMD